MNKEQKKPQEISSATKPRRICYLCEEELPCEHYPQDDDLYPEYEKYGDIFKSIQLRDGTVTEYVRAYKELYNFIQKIKRK